MTIENLRIELNNHLRDYKRKNYHVEPDHVVFFGNVVDGNVSARYAFCHREQLHEVIEFLKDKVQYLRINQLGIQVTSITKKSTGTAVLDNCKK
ncbi:hypothetical protein Q7A53_05435 [Halobacillus rhizosphaerae]|uniref:hypothetical protein n=1 Tax=Halobacillus rhizosphaerae TaxID=3064889 RepID=UPI00398B74A2